MIKKILLFPFKMLWSAIRITCREMWKMFTTSGTNYN